MSPRAAAKPPTLAGFRYVEVLGSGGFADVYRYTQLGLGRDVAVKVLLHGLGRDAQEQLQAEAELMAMLSNHPSIVSIYQAGLAEDGRPYLVMEVCRPGHLGARLRRQPLSVPRTLEIGIQVAGAVETAHRLGVLHRDIKPANILFTEFNRPALTDFGISTSARTGEGQTAFSVAWAPPEQLEGRPTGPSADVYSLAATLWAALVGRNPFEVPGGRNDSLSVAERVRTQPVPPTGRLDVPPSLERVLATALAKQPGQRFASALDFARALQAVQAEVHVPLTTVDIQQRALDDDYTVVEDSGTRVTGFLAVDPQARTSGTDPHWTDISGSTRATTLGSELPGPPWGTSASALTDATPGAGMEGRTPPAPGAWGALATPAGTEGRTPPLPWGDPDADPLTQTGTVLRGGGRQPVAEEPARVRGRWGRHGRASGADAAPASGQPGGLGVAEARGVPGAQSDAARRQPGPSSPHHPAAPAAGPAADAARQERRAAPGRADGAPASRALGGADAPRSEPSRRGRTLARVVGGVAALALVGAGIGLAAINGGLPGTTVSTPTPTAPRPEDPIGTVVPRPVTKAATVQGDKVVFTWTNPDPKPGDSYLYVAQVPGTPQVTHETTEPTASVATQPGRTCITVSTKRANGRASDAAEFCTP